LFIHVDTLSQDAIPDLGVRLDITVVTDQGAFDRSVCRDLGLREIVEFEPVDTAGKKVHMSFEITFRSTKVTPIRIFHCVGKEISLLGEKIGKNMIFERPVLVLCNGLTHGRFENVNSGVYVIELLFADLIWIGFFKKALHAMFFVRFYQSEIGRVIYRRERDRSLSVMRAMKFNYA